MELTEEKWVKIEGHDMYEVSNLGRVRNMKNNKINTHHLNNNGYLMCHLRNPNKPQYFFRKSLHRMLALAFIPNPENKRCVNHINGIKSDNSLPNLEWCTHSENSIHAHKTGLMLSRKKHYTWLNENEVYDVLDSYHNKKESTKILSDKYKISRSNIYRIIKGDVWRNQFDNFMISLNKSYESR